MGRSGDGDIRDSRENQIPPRPCLTVNKVIEKIDLAEGEFRQMSPSYKVRAVDSQGDPIMADVIAGMVRHIEYNSKAADVAYKPAYNCVLMGGRGYWRINVQDTKENPFLRELAIGGIDNPLAVYTDPAAKMPDKSDMNWCFIVDNLLKEDFERDYGEIQVSDWDGEDIWQDWVTEKTVRIAEYWWKEWKDVKYYKLHDGQVVKDIDEDEFLGMEYLIADTKTVKEPQIKWCKLAANKILKEKEDFPGDYIPIIYVPGKTGEHQRPTQDQGHDPLQQRPATDVQLLE